jgi:hypothetical protein
MPSLWITLRLSGSVVVCMFVILLSQNIHKTFTHKVQDINYTYI